MLLASQHVSQKCTMALIRSDYHGVPVIHLLGDDGYAMVTALTLSLRFQFRAESLYVEEEICDSDRGLVSQAMGQLSFKNNDGKI